MRRENLATWLWIAGIWLATGAVSLLVPVSADSDPGGTTLIPSGIAVLALLALSAVAASALVLAWGRSDKSERIERSERE